MPSGEAASCSSCWSVIPGCSFWQCASAAWAAATCWGVGDAGAAVVDEVVCGVGAAPPLGGVLVAAGGALCAGAECLVVGVLLGVVAWVLAGGWVAVLTAPAEG
jgi:hypothetical protein